MLVFMALKIILLVLTIIVYSFMVFILRSYISLFNHSCHIIIENDLAVFS